MTSHTQTSTKVRVLVAGLRLFGERGYTAASMRAITEAADVNVAAVNYHFGGKAELLRAVVEFVMSEVNAERARILDALIARPASPTADDLVDAFIDTGARLTDRSDGLGSDFARFLGRVICEPQPEVRRLFGTAVSPVEHRYLEALKVALPALAADAVEFRYRCMIGLLALHQTGTLVDLGTESEDDRESRRQADNEQLRRVAKAIFHE